MRKLTVIPIVFVMVLTALCSKAQYDSGFAIRGVLPWHNFLSGPTSWNEADYKRYLDDCAAEGINFIGFHNYTGGGERYVSYVEPLIKISVKGITPTAFLDNSQTARWGYQPMSVKDFAFGTSKLYALPEGVNAFGADCSVLPKTNEGRYAAAQNLMKKVVVMAHDRHMQVAMGFEFGVLPPEYYSLTEGGNESFYWRGEANMVPNPAHPFSIELLQATIDNILQTYPSIDYIWLWLNEHSFMGVDVPTALKDSSFNGLYQRNSSLFSDKEDNERTKFIGVWSLEFIRQAYRYIHEKAPGVKVMIGGWGGGNQLPVILNGLDKGLPKDVLFTCLNPGLGHYSQPEFLANIAKNRHVMAIPWLEGDNQLWHYQPRVQLLRTQVKQAWQQHLYGIAAIHWRTKETKLNFHTFSRFARNPADSISKETLYREFLLKQCGPEAAKQLTGLFSQMDTASWRNDLSSPEYYAYTPQWGRMSAEGKAATGKMLQILDTLTKSAPEGKYLKQLDYFRNMFKFELLLDEVGRKIEPTYIVKNEFQLHGSARKDDIDYAWQKLQEAPVKLLFSTFAKRVRSRGELGELSSINQRLWSKYLELKKFLIKQKSEN